MGVTVVDKRAFGLDTAIGGMNPVGMNLYGAFDSTNAANPYGSPAFFAPLKTTLVLSRGTGDPTFTRATTAYVKDFEDVWREVPSGAARFEGARVVRNFVPYSEDATQWTINANGITTTSDAGSVSYDGQSIDLDYLEETATTDYHRLGISLAVSITNRRGSFFAKANGRTKVRVWTWAGGDDTYAYFNLSTGVASGSLNPSMELVDVDVYRCSYDVDYRHTSAIVGPADDVVTAANTYLGEVGKGILVGGWQIEELSTGASEYVSTAVLSAPYHGAGVDGIKYFATDRSGAAIPDATLKGYFAEGQRQNRCLHAQDFSNGVWVSGGGGITVTTNTAVAPDGTTTADTLTAAGANGTLIQDLGVVASAAKAGGLYLKRKTGTGNIDLTLDGGSTWTTVAVTSSWLLLEKTQTLADEDFGIRIVTSGDAVYAWQAQVETATFISSPIPTTTAAVTRNGDVLTYSPTGNVGDSESTVYCETTINAFNPAGLNKIILLAVCMGIDRYNTTDIALRGMGISVDTLLNLADDTFGKCAFVAKEAASRAAVNGSLYSNNTTTAYVTPTRIDIGVDNISNQVFGNVRNVRIWTKALPDATLQSMTT